MLFRSFVKPLGEKDFLRRKVSKKRMSDRVFSSFSIEEILSLCYDVGNENEIPVYPIFPIVFREET